MRYLKSLSIFLSVVLLSLTVVSCDEDGLTDPEPENEGINSDTPAMFEVKLTDAPGDFESVFIDIQKVKIHRADSAEMDTTRSDSTEADSTANDDERWITVSDEAMRVDLLTLQNGNTITLGRTEIEPGTYDQMRLVLGNDNEVVVDGESHFLKTPSAQQSGLKLQIDAEIKGNRSYTLLVDFDASRSIVNTGNGNNPNFNYLLKPVLRAVNLQETGSVSGVVEPSDFTTSVFTVLNEDTIATTTEEDGSFQILGLAEGFYNLNFDPDSAGFQDTTITDVEILSGEDTDIGTVTLPENEN